MVGEVRVVAGEHEDGVLEPGLAAGAAEELAEGHVGIADTLMDLDALLGEALAVFLGYDVGVMAAGGKDGSHKRFLHLRHLGAVVLQEGLVPDGPGAVELLFAAKALVAAEVLTAIIVFESRAAGEGLESHGTALGTVEEGGLIPFAAKD